MLSISSLSALEDGAFISEIRSGKLPEWDELASCLSKGHNDNNFFMLYLASDLATKTTLLLSPEWAEVECYTAPNAVQPDSQTTCSPCPGGFMIRRCDRTRCKSFAGYQIRDDQLYRFASSEDAYLDHSWKIDDLIWS